MTYISDTDLTGLTPDTGFVVSGGKFSRDPNYLPHIGTHAARLAQSPLLGLLWKESDTGLIYLGDGSAWNVWKGDGKVVKTADETVNNSNTLQNDDHLFFPIEASEIWFFKLALFVTGLSTTADLKINWSLPSGATIMWLAEASGLGVSTAASPQAVISTANSALGTANNTSLQQLVGLITNSTTAGTAQFQWAQNTATAEDTKLLKGSQLRIWRQA